MHSWQSWFDMTLYPPGTWSAATLGPYQQRFRSTDLTLRSRTTCVGHSHLSLHQPAVDLAQESHSSHQTQQERQVSPTGLQQAVVCVHLTKILKYFLQYTTWIRSLEAQNLCCSLINTTILASLHCFTSSWSLICQTYRTTGTTNQKETSNN